MRIFTILIFSFICTSSFANDVDKLKTDREVETFVRTQVPSLADARLAYKDFLYPNAIKQKTADSLGVKLWQKADFNNDGKSDLLAYINTSGQNYLAAFIDEGGSFSVHLLSKWPFAYIYCPVIEKRNNLTLLVLFKMCGYCHPKADGLMGADTLIYRFGDFIDYMPDQTVFKPHKIEKIEFSTSPCIGTCPVFEMDITSDRKAQYHAISYNDTTGVFNSQIDTLHYNKLMRLLTYVDFPNLRDDYRVTWTDDQAATLTITYDGGQIKRIYDYGEVGTHGLSMIYGIVYDLRKNQSWKLISK